MQTIAFATGLRDDEGPAVMTAAALASAGRAKLVTVHATTDGPVEVPPRAREAAARWGSTLESEVVVHTCCEDPADTLLDALQRVRPDLLVVGTHGRTGLAQIVSESVSESVARNIPVPTLFVPLSGNGLADPSTGAVRLQRIVVAAGDALATRTGIEAAVWLARAVGAERVELVLLHVDDGTEAPEFGDVPAGFSIVRRSARGSLTSAIVDGAAGLEACAIVMATRGHDGVMDTLTGSHTEHVLRKVACPLLSVPLTS